MGKTVFDLYKIGIGPSSSHTVGPMVIAKKFVDLAYKRELLDSCSRVKIELFGSLGATGRGHGSDVAVVQGLIGNLPETIDIKRARKYFSDVIINKNINLLDIKKLTLILKMI